MSPITIGITARERYSYAARTIASIYENTRVPFKLLIADAGTPKRYRKQIERSIRGRRNAEILSRDEVLLNNAARNWIIESVDSDAVVLIENDNLVSRGWVTELLRTSDEFSADVVTPLIYEGKRWPGRIHFDIRNGFISQVVDDAGKSAIRVTRDISRIKMHPRSAAKIIHGFESHCLLIRREFLARTDVFDPQMTMRREIAESIAVFLAGGVAAIAPRAQILFVPPPPIETAEREFFRATWDLDRARHSHDRIIERWNVLDLPDSFRFLGRRVKRETYLSYFADEFRHRASEWLARRRKAA